MIKKKHFYLILIPILISLLIPINVIEYEENNLEKPNTISYPKSSYITHNPILIDGNSEFESFPNKTGLGTSESPFIIEDLYINTENSANGIYINNVSYSFKIQNCHIENSGLLDYDAGINLNNCSAAEVSLCNTSYNTNGICVTNSFNCNISNNIAISNYVYPKNIGSGIRLLNTNNSIIDGNYVENHYLGINITNSFYNNVSKNYGREVTNDIGIGLINSHNNTLSENYNIRIQLSESDYNRIENNNHFGISLSQSNRNIIDNNSGYNSLYLTSSNHNQILSNSLTEAGIFLSSSSNNIIRSNIVKENDDHGIKLSDCDNNILSMNVANDNYYSGIYVSYGENNIISENEVIHNNYCGIYLYQGSNNSVLDNTANNQVKYNGIGMFNSHNNNIIGNVANGNGHSGIWFEGHCDDNLIVSNSFLNNLQYGIYIEESESDHNSFYLNNLDGNTLFNAVDNGWLNAWDNGVKGNYWGDYEEKYPSATNNGIIWNTPYEIEGDSNAKDNFPIYIDNTPDDDNPDPNGENESLISGYPLMLISLSLGIIIILKKSKLKNEV